MQVSFASFVASVDYVKAKTLRGLAITSATRWPLLPDLPTMGEFLEGCEASIWLGLSAPRNTPAAIVEQLNTEINAGLADHEFVARLAALGGRALRVSPAGYAKLVASGQQVPQR
jgi:tripartite-type tricarboxylate transporter receptor subunit TctC